MTSRKLTKRFWIIRCISRRVDRGLRYGPIDLDYSYPFIELKVKKIL